MDDLFLYRITRKIAKIQHILDIDLLTGFFIDAVMVCIDDLHHTGSHGTIT